MHAHNAWAPSGGTALLVDKGTLEALPGHCCSGERYEQMGMCVLCHVVVGYERVHTHPEHC